MTLADLLGLQVSFRAALSIGIVVSLVAALITTRKAIPKLLGAGITGVDANKPDNPRVAEMGGIAVFLAFNVGAFTALGFGELHRPHEVVVLASLVVAAGACITGVLDDLIEIRQRFKALIPFAFAAPLALYVSDFVVEFPLIGAVDFSWFYPLVLVPLGVASASNGFNMLEGFNGLGAGLGIILAAAISLIAIAEGQLSALALTFPLVGALGGFIWFNAYPARIFPGDTMTLFTGSVLGCAIVIGKLEFWGGLLLLPHVVEFFLKLRHRFEVESFATGREGDKLAYVGPVASLAHMAMKTFDTTESGLVTRFWVAEALYACGVVLAYSLAA